MFLLIRHNPLKTLYYVAFSSGAAHLMREKCRKWTNCFGYCFFSCSRGAKL